jgi:hypothetical protein
VRVRGALLVLAVTAGCAGEADKTAACDLGTHESAATVQDRKLIGGVNPYVPDLTLAGRDAELASSSAARRAAAWQTIAKVLAPTPLAGASSFQLPAWHTWFARDDFERVFKKLYRDLGPAGRAARASFDDATLDAGFAWNTTAVDELPEWTAQRFADYVAAIDTQDKAQGIGGIYRVEYSTGAMMRLVGSYAQQYGCRTSPDPEPYAEQPMRPGQPVAYRAHVDVGGCEWRVLGPFVAGASASLVVSSTGDGDADVYLRRGSAPAPDAYDCKSAGDTSAETCAVDGGDTVYVAIFGAKRSALDVAVDYVAEDVAQPTCLTEEMPRDAVLVKAEWRRALSGESLPVFDTSADRMRERLAGDADWGDGDALADPDPSTIYTATLPDGSTYRLPALHIMTKELDHWQWITLWWSPDPDSDFGADRPGSIAQLPGPWTHYKMCTVTAYLDGASGEPTWCSNPYIEHGAGNAATNCIGCHQHGGTDLSVPEILQLPDHGATRARNNFFTDYLWAIKGGLGEDLSATVQAEVDYWDANDP